MTSVRVCLVAALATVGATPYGQTPTPIPISSRLTGAVQDYVVRAGDTLRVVSARFGIDERVLVANNRLTAPVRLVPGQRLTIDNRHIVPVAVDHEEIVVNVPQRVLFLLRPTEPPRAFPVAAGRPDWATPPGPFKVVMKEEHPTWDVPVSIQREMRRTGKPVIVRMPPGPANPLGDHWIGLSIPSLGLHGTPSLSSIYRLATHGCVRLHPDDVRVLFDAISVGTRGSIVYEPILLARISATVFLEVHPDAYRRRHLTIADVRHAAEADGLTNDIDWTIAAAVFARKDGVAQDISTR